MTYKVRPRKWLGNKQIGALDFSEGRSKWFIDYSECSCGRVNKLLWDKEEVLHKFPQLSRRFSRTGKANLGQSISTLLYALPRLRLVVKESPTRGEELPENNYWKNQTAWYRQVENSQP